MSDQSQSTFPNQIDTFPILQSLSAEKYAEAQELKTLMATTNKTDTQITRMNELIVGLKNYYINPDTWNKFCNCLISMEVFISQNVDGYIDTKQTEMNTYVTTKKQEVDDKVNYFSTSVDSIINQFQDLGEYNPTVDYNPKNMIEYHGSTYINILPCRDIPPTNKMYWKVLATGYVMQGAYDYNTEYEIRDLVYFNIEKGIYECISPAGIGISPYDTNHWKLLFNVKDLIVEINDYTNDTESLYIAHNGFTINHNLGKYVKALAINLGGNSYGHFGFGQSGFGSSIAYEVLTKSEYVDLNNVKLYLSEPFNGTPTVTKISDTVYQVAFSEDNTLQVQLY